MHGTGDFDLPVQLLEINEQLVLATLRAQVLAEEAESAHRLVAESEQRFRSLVTSTASIIWYASAEGDIRTDSVRWLEITGLDSTAAGFEWITAVHPDDRARVQAAWLTALETRTVFECEYRLCKRGGGDLWVFSRGVPLPGDGAPVREWIGMITDVTDRKRVEETRERFISVLGHDLRTPLGAIQIGADTLQRAQDLPQEHARLVELISRCSRRMGRMIADVLDFARGRLGSGIPLACVPTDFGEVCAEAISELQVAHPGHPITFEPGDDLAGVWDRDRLAQTLTNLVSNAVVHGAGPVLVTLRPDRDAVVLEVQNYGVPIPAEEVRVVFEPFRRGANHGKHDGLGLGLYIVSEIVRAHGGAIWARSSAIGGTSFISRWPRRPPPGSDITA